MSTYELPCRTKCSTVHSTLGSERIEVCTSMKVALVVVGVASLAYGTACRWAQKNHYPDRSGPKALARYLNRLAWEATQA